MPPLMSAATMPRHRLPIFGSNLTSQASQAGQPAVTIDLRMQVLCTPDQKRPVVQLASQGQTPLVAMAGCLADRPLVKTGRSTAQW